MSTNMGCPPSMGLAGLSPIVQSHVTCEAHIHHSRAPNTCTREIPFSFCIYTTFLFHFKFKQKKPHIPSVTHNKLSYQITMWRYQLFKFQITHPKKKRPKPKLKNIHHWVENTTIYRLYMYMWRGTWNPPATTPKYWNFHWKSLTNKSKTP